LAARLNLHRRRTPDRQDLDVNVADVLKAVRLSTRDRHRSSSAVRRTRMDDARWKKGDQRVHAGVEGVRRRTAKKARSRQPATVLHSIQQSARSARGTSCLFVCTWGSFAPFLAPIPRVHTLFTLIPAVRMRRRWWPPPAATRGLPVSTGPTICAGFSQ